MSTMNRMAGFFVDGLFDRLVLIGDQRNLKLGATTFSPTTLHNFTYNNNKNVVTRKGVGGNQPP
jgi:hypothetical protein